MIFMVIIYLASARLNFKEKKYDYSNLFKNEGIFP